jgi:hypothetical protein
MVYWDSRIGTWLNKLVSIIYWCYNLPSRFTDGIWILCFPGDGLLGPKHVWNKSLNKIRKVLRILNIVGHYCAFLHSLYIVGHYCAFFFIDFVHSGTLLCIGIQFKYSGTLLCVVIQFVNSGTLLCFVTQFVYSGILLCIFFYRFCT